MNQDQGKTGGFFTRVLNKVTGASAQEESGPQGQDSGGVYSKQALNQVVERKRRNDAIRVQEFSELRQLRSKGRTAGAPVSAPASAFLPSSLESETEARTATTLQKIDAIEAQMAHQWWRTKSDGTAAPAAVMAAGGVALPTVPGVLTAGERPALNAVQLQSIPALDGESVVRQRPAAVPAFHASPDLEEAAILFAHGDLGNAKARLLELLVQGLDRTPVDNQAVATTWHAVLDLYRATGDEEGFEPLAIDYATHFGRSAPLWFSMPGQLGLAPLAGGVALQPQRRDFRWNAPAILTAEAVGVLEAGLQMSPAPWRLDWAPLVQIEPAALPLLNRLLDHWASQRGQWVVTGAGVLQALLAAQTPPGERERSPQWWALRMALLRMLDQPAGFEQLALDYCVTYEVSPPSWTEPRCQCQVHDEGGPATVWMESSQFAPHSHLAESPLSPEAGGPLPVGREEDGLCGVIEGDAMPWLQPLQARARLGVPLEIPCDWLIRLDFVAAGSVLNWACDMQALGHVLRFTQLHHLVAVFFHVIGIQEHAGVSVRKA